MEINHLYGRRTIPPPNRIFKKLFHDNFVFYVVSYMIVSRTALQKRQQSRKGTKSFLKKSQRIIKKNLSHNLLTSGPRRSAGERSISLRSEPPSSGNWYKELGKGMLDQVKCKFSYHLVLNYYLSEGHFTAAPVPEYTMSGTYSTDRLRGARPGGSPRRLAVAGGAISI